MKVKLIFDSGFPTLIYNMPGLALAVARWGQPSGVSRRAFGLVFDFPGRSFTVSGLTPEWTAGRAVVRVEVEPAAYEAALAEAKAKTEAARAAVRDAEAALALARDAQARAWMRADKPARIPRLALKAAERGDFALARDRLRRVDAARLARLAPEEWAEVTRALADCIGGPIVRALDALASKLDDVVEETR